MIIFPAAVSNFIDGEVSFSSAPQTLVKIAYCTASFHTARRCVCDYLKKEPCWGGLFIHLLCTQKVFSPSWRRHCSVAQICKTESCACVCLGEGYRVASVPLVKIIRQGFPKLCIGLVIFSFLCWLNISKVSWTLPSALKAVEDQCVLRDPLKLNWKIDSIEIERYRNHCPICI